MIVIGLLSTKQEADEIKYVAKICALEDRVRFIVRKQRMKELMDLEDQINK